MIEALFIVGVLGTLETTFWLADRKELREQTRILSEQAALLDELLVTLSIKEQKEP